jgi:hypothetical protein
VSVDPAERVVPDDRVLKVTKAVSVAIVPVLTAAFVILFLFPGQTKALWSWTIKSRMSAMFMGGGYVAGALFFFRAWRATEWHRLGPGIIATTGFATLLGIATFVDWDQFNHTHVSFWAWTALYVATPILLPWLYVRNRVYDPGTLAPGDVRVPRPIRTVLGAVGAAQLLFALALYCRPSAFQSHWPWPLTALTARSLAGFATFPALTYLAFAFESRWSALRWPFETAIVGVALIAVAAARSSGDFRGGTAAVLWRIGLVGALAMLVAVWVSMQREVARAGGGAGVSAPA